VLESCEECGFVYDLSRSGHAGVEIRALAAEYATLLAREDAALRRRQQPDVWSALEYACHVRDVLLAQRERVLLARRETCPQMVPMGRDERVEHDGYNDQAPADVARQLTDAALKFANALSRLEPSDWERELVYNYPDRQPRSLHWLAVHTLHEVRHHLSDVRRQL
jgi:hypothetical protein